MSFTYISAFRTVANKNKINCMHNNAKYILDFIGKTQKIRRNKINYINYTYLYGSIPKL